MMNPKQKRLRQRQLDRALLSEKAAKASLLPNIGWVQMIREALGMSREVLGKRLSVSRQTVHQLEEAEVKGTITLNRLRAAAEAMGCEVSVQIIPKQSLEAMVRQQALRVARTQILKTDHSMALEDQAVDKADAQQLIEDLADDLIRRGDQLLWS